MGTLGPLVHMSVGESVQIVLRNSLQFPVNIVPQGLQYSSASPVAPGDTKSFVWTADSYSGPTYKDRSTVAWIYHSTVKLYPLPLTSSDQHHQLSTLQGTKYITSG